MKKIDTKYSEKFLIFLYFLINDYDINNGMFLETVRNGGKKWRNGGKLWVTVGNGGKRWVNARKLQEIVCRK